MLANEGACYAMSQQVFFCCFHSNSAYYFTQFYNLHDIVTSLGLNRKFVIMETAEKEQNKERHQFLMTFAHCSTFISLCSPFRIAPLFA